MTQKTCDQKLVGLKKQKQALTAALEKGRPALLIGEAGTGKTTLAQELAGELSRPFYRVNLNGYVTPDMLIGRFQARAKNGTETFFQYGILPRAMKEGAILILDEINAALPDTLFCLHAVMEDKPRVYIPETEEEVTPADGFSIVATMNPSHDYAGTRGLNAALYSRFAVVLRFPTLSGAELLEALKMHAPTADEKAILEVGRILEKSAEARKLEKINTRLTIREAISALQLLPWMNRRDAIEAALYGKLEPSERGEVTSSVVESDLEMTIQDAIDRARQFEAMTKKIDRLEKELNTMKELRATLELFTAKQAEEAGKGGAA